MGKLHKTKVRARKKKRKKPPDLENTSSKRCENEPEGAPRPSIYSPKEQERETISSNEWYTVKLEDILVPVVNLNDVRIESQLYT